MIKHRASGKLTKAMKTEEEAHAKAGEGDTSESEETALVDGLDYYLENGLMVFTARFLRRRGYCCDNGCRHCPYENAQDRKQ